ncbi:MAG: UTP--glucose-1-phosphate uridylyltransferase [Candidatus Kerfeldbacteria bacterium RIFCSPHIGHO2_02_FULL_42_14]|uniref:UTP--glucose-1-phosphate uridylyltransferase n=1 Tax=Candidatus Kerfeldbacteria bacterium RIFCSPHIGHO2_02_FULL_42_14 TaxID=1798540 RepID=A0A1G2AQH9_9BACT|nr:MAG: UTP--glucose-1-phosphate uridylyltransferase [Candidatus Kerfeldbacteria bacterium RIFCSPHIGHO2_02_FULL_42_14]OGY80901.1 MAG: UTP--glucose-1-phosphate uridylyltransferase [Candidatus Kerfeldbacteria bacterium RIFCSPHIGHO2_12_FULL_42_13]OGY84134.1 MAG: UTP--glucose-1-phosphate uridylyltransferase [Candidatus Kerfeldbacteria bacterium RIFCSPLOWO2_02_FULL_42_19]OGY87264.1 MAG: UTP--glucose-1-phosphate uridylyltransferase [Candidatus Kerfeldbacteria bacterium RIFCSPLOWO2_12_FULL_43_9]
MTKIRKAIIPAAGMGTRFLPATKAQPKEMLPVVDKPIIQYVVEEAVASGIEDIIIVTGWHKRSIEDHFDHSFELEQHLKQAGKIEQLKEIRRIANMANFIYIRQKGPYGNGTPVLSARHLVEDEPFAVLWGDEFIYSHPPRLKQIIDVYEKYEMPVISGVKIEKKELLSNYGIAETQTLEPGIHRIVSIVEKPKPEQAPSNLAVHGAYILTPEILDILSETKPGKGNEIWLIDALNTYMKSKTILAREIQDGKYYDTGNKLEYLKANIDFALERKELRKPLLSYMKQKMRENGHKIIPA